MDNFEKNSDNNITNNCLHSYICPVFRQEINMDTKELIYTLFTGGYVFETILLGVLLLVCSRLFEGKAGRMHPFRKVFSIVLFTDAAVTLAAIFMGLHFGWDERVSCISSSLDGFVFATLFVAGFALNRDLMPSLKIWIKYVLPYVLILALQFMGFRPHLLITDIAVTVVTLSFFLEMCISSLRHDMKLKDGYSNFEGYSTMWYVLLSVLIIVNAVFSFLPELPEGAGYWVGCIYNVAIFLAWMVSAYYAIRQKETSTVTPDDLPQKSAKTMDGQSAGNVVAREMQKLMDEEKVYLNPDLTIESLAKRLNTNTTYIYRCLHSDLHTSFYEYVNGKRIEYSQKVLIETDDKIESVAIQSGFNSSRAFLRVFKQFTGEPPTVWRNRQKR